MSALMVSLAIRDPTLTPVPTLYRLRGCPVPRVATIFSESNQSLTPPMQPHRPLRVVRTRQEKPHSRNLNHYATFINNSVRDAHEDRRRSPRSAPSRES